MRTIHFIVLLFSIHAVFAEEYELNEYALHSNARNFSLGGLNCSYEDLKNNKMIITYLMPFQLKELSIRKLEFNKNALGLEWNAGWFQSGSAVWMENNLKLHLGKRLNEKLYLGVAFNTLIVDKVTEGSVSAFFAELDCRYFLSDNLTISINMINPGGARIKLEERFIPLSCSAHIGGCYSSGRKCRLYTEFAAQLNHPARCRIGLEYEIYDAFILRTGFCTGPMMPSWGIGSTLNHFWYSWGGNLHPILGISNGFTLGYGW